MPTLFSYCVRWDGGSAPNPFGQVCTLVICKPAIRRTAEVGDWVVGTGSKNSPVGDASGRMVYAMRISEKLTMEEYDQRCRKMIREKIPEWTSSDPQEQMGDCIYDYSSSPPAIRPSTHSEENRKTDLGGKYALLSDHFFYFGKNAPMLPENLLALVKQGPGHRAQANANLLHPFLGWIGKQKPGRQGEPQYWEPSSVSSCGSSCAKHDEEDERAGCD